MYSSKEEILGLLKQKKISKVEAFELIKKFDQKPKSSTFSFSSENSYIRDHIVMQQRVLMGVTHCGLAIEAFRKKFVDVQSCQLKGVQFTDAIKMKPNETVDVAVELNDKNGKLFFENQYSVLGRDAIKKLTAKGEISQTKNTAPKSVDLSAFKKMSTTTLVGSEIYEKSKTELSGYGKTLWTLKNYYAISEKECLVELAISPEVLSQRSFYFHPALLDGAFMGSMTLSAVKDNFVPLFIKELNVFSESPGKCYCHIKLIRSNSELVVVDMAFTDDKGNVFAEAKEFSNKRVSSMDAFGVAPNKMETSTSKNRTGKESKSVIAKNSAVSKPIMSRTGNLEDKIEAYIVQSLEKIVSGSFDKQKNFLEMGIESNNLIEMSKAIEKDVGVELYPTLFFEYQNIKALKEYFTSE